MNKLYLFFLLLFPSLCLAQSNYDILSTFINKKVDGCKITNVKYDESSNNILIVCIKDTNKIYHLYLDIKAGFECGEFHCGSEDVTKQVLELLDGNR